MKTFSKVTLFAMAVLLIGVGAAMACTPGQDCKDEVVVVPDTQLAAGDCNNCKEQPVDVPEAQLAACVPGVESFQPTDEEIFGEAMKLALNSLGKCFAPAADDWRNAIQQFSCFTHGVRGSGRNGPRTPLLISVAQYNPL